MYHSIWQEISQFTLLPPDPGALPENAKFAGKITVRCFLDGIEVSRTNLTRVLAVLGDSLTDGAGTDRDQSLRFTDLLAARFYAAKQSVSVLNFGVGGSRLLHNRNRNDSRNRHTGLGDSLNQRWQRELNNSAGLTDVLLEIGINDIGQPPQSAPESETVSAETLISSLRELLQKIRASQPIVRIYLATLTPTGGNNGGYFSIDKEAKRQKVNSWIRSNQVADGFFDFDLALRDVRDASRLSQNYDSGDHLHPNAAGYLALANLIDLKLFCP